jgi:hypothetical protein
MAVDPRKRQKKLERRKAKQKAERRELARHAAGGIRARFEQASKAPILHCFAADVVWQQGIGEVLISRQLKDGNVAFVTFLLDMYCLGVKTVIMNIVPPALYRERMYRRLADEYQLVPLKPECARKLVEGAVAYALDLGLPPDPEYRIARLIFGDVQAEACDQTFVYGKDGKPFFVAGPRDDPARCKEVIRTLEESCGPGGFHFLIPIAGDTEVRIMDEGPEPRRPL